MQLTGECTAPTLVFIPAAVHYPNGYDVCLSDGSYTVEVAAAEKGGYHILSYVHSPGEGSHALQLSPKGDGDKRRRRRPPVTHVALL